jgi:hypothetical protein
MRAITGFIWWHLLAIDVVIFGVGMWNVFVIQDFAPGLGLMALACLIYKVINPERGFW